MNVFTGIVRITIVTRSWSVGRRGLQSTLRFASKTGEGQAARAGDEAADTARATRTNTARTTNVGLTSDPHRNFLACAEADSVPEGVGDPEADEPGEQVPCVCEVQQGKARRRGRWRRARRGGGRRWQPEGDGDRGRRGREERHRGDERVSIQD